MARQTTVQLIDDLGGGSAEVTVRFGWGGVDYEIDLSAAHAEQFVATVRRYVDAARRVGSAGQHRRDAGRSGARSGRSGDELAAIRSWARANGMTVADRGRISADVVEAFRASRATSPDSTPEPTATAATGDVNKASAPSANTSTTKTSAAKKSPAKKSVAKAHTATRAAAAKKAPAKQCAAKKAVPAKRSRVSKSSASAGRRARKSTGGKRSTGTAARRTR